MKAILRRIRPGQPVLLGLDYDGTLVPIKRRPELARLSLRRRRILKLLGERSKIVVVSGRSLADLRRCVGLPGLDSIGNHGLEIFHRGRTWEHPEARSARPALQRVLGRVRRRLRTWPGVGIEDKGLTASVHYRRLEPALRRPLSRLVKQEVAAEAGRLHLVPGKRIWDIRPDIAWDKGKGLERWARWARVEKASQWIYIGDDRTDEDAFRLVRHRGLAIRVGCRRKTMAQHILPRVSDVWKLLGRLLELAEDKGKRSLSRARRPSIPE